MEDRLITLTVRQRMIEVRSTFMAAIFRGGECGAISALEKTGD